MRSIHAFLASLLKFLYLEPLREAFIPMEGMPRGTRLLAWTGYAAIAGLLGITILSALPGISLGAVTFPMTMNDNQVTAYVPLLVVLAVLVGFLLGWAYLLSGATNSQPLIFLPFMLLFCVQLACLVPFNSQSSGWLLAWLCVILPLLFLTALLYLLTHKKAFWREYPLLEFGLWLFLLGLCGLFLFLGRQSLFEMSASLHGIFSLLFLLLLPLWLLLGLSVVDLGLEVASRLVLALRRWLPLNALQALALFVLIARPAMLLLWILWDSIFQRGEPEPSLLANGIFVDAVLSIPLLIVLLITVLSRRWDGYRAAKLLVLSLTVLVFSVGLTFSMGGIDLSNPLEITMQSVSVLPAVLVFVAMLVYNVLGLGTRFAHRDSRSLPRQGRVLLVFGLALLVTSLFVFMTNLRDEAGHSILKWEADFSNFFALGLMLLGLPYLIWIAWKRGERLVGGRAEFEAVAPRFAALLAVSNRRLTVLAVLCAFGFLVFVYLLLVLI